MFDYYHFIINEVILLILFTISLFVFRKKIKKLKKIVYVLIFVIVFDLINMWFLFSDITSINIDGFYKDKNYHYAVIIKKTDNVDERLGVTYANIYIQPYLSLFGENLSFNQDYNSFKKIFTKYHYGLVVEN